MGDDDLKLLQGIGGDQEVFCRFTKDFTKQDGNFTNRPVHILLAAGYSSPGSLTSFNLDACFSTVIGRVGEGG